ncbi:MAG TPA: hypothetical protein VES96_03930 [Nitrospiraceae bacterium]|nr:hypothetical protein [Nitrospiraceae bacterium]
MDAGSVLTSPGNIVFSTNLPFLKDLTAAGGRVARQPSGHLVFYGPGNRRFLATDLDGNPLHECEWGTTASGRTRLLRARIRLEWGQWIGLQPEGLVNTTTLDLSKKPGWERLRPDDLRQMAAQAMHVPLDAVKLFYGDEDLIIDSKGTATIRHKKDAFYVLDDGTFERARFMACMGAMHWAAIDFLPVVELFQSLLPGTGSAAFELIRGFYDDQNGESPAPLRYRGIPAYPSEAAFRLFSGFFSPQAPGGSNPLPVFMDVTRSHEVTWLPTANPPVRFFDRSHNLCVTVKGMAVQKATKFDDPTGLPFLHPDPGGNPLNRTVIVAKGILVLRDRDTNVELPVNPAWGPLQDSLAETRPPAPSGGWTAFFGGRPPHVAPHEAFSAVLLYPDDDSEIGEVASQSFAADYIQDSFEQDPRLATHLANAVQVLIDNFDGAIKTCISLDKPRHYAVLYARPAHAQKQAQNLWSELARSQRFDFAKRVSFIPSPASQDAYRKSYDLLFVWLPFAIFTDTIAQHEAIRLLAGAIGQGGLAFIVGPASLRSMFKIQPQLQILSVEPVESMPTFQMHRTVLPKARLKQGLTLFHVVKR